MEMSKYLGTPLSEKDFETVAKEAAKPSAKYRYTTGIALGRFLDELRRGRIIGTVCSHCRRVYVPPRIYCSHCFRELSEWIYVRDEGTIQTAVLTYISTTRERMEKPLVVGVIKLDLPEGYGDYAVDETFYPGVMHYICGATEEDVKSRRIFGKRVKAKWRSEKTGSIRDIECFEVIP